MAPTQQPSGEQPLNAQTWNKEAPEPSSTDTARSVDRWDDITGDQEDVLYRQNKQAEAQYGRSTDELEELQAFDAALREAADEGADRDLQPAMRVVAAHQLMFKEELSVEEEDRDWPWLRDGQRIGYRIQMRLLYQANNTSLKNRVLPKIDPGLLRRPTGELSSAMENWFECLERGKSKAQRDFDAMSRMAKFSAQ